MLCVDVGVRLNGWFGDGAFTLAVGELAADVESLLRATQQALDAGVRAAVADKHLSDISHAVETIANEAGVTVIQEYGGHGIGRELHEEPHIPNHGAPGRGPRLQVGQVIAIEPIFSLGAPEVVVDEDGWTTRTKDGSAAAHFEHTVAITCSTGQPRLSRKEILSSMRPMEKLCRVRITSGASVSARSNNSC